MPPPPVTPSPHRFVIKKQPARKVLTQETPRPNTQQFKSTPRFNLSSTPRFIPSQTLPTSTPSVTRYSTPARPKPSQEDFTDNFSDGQDVQESIETKDQELDTGYLTPDLPDDYAIEERSAKRRRFSSPPLLLDEDIKTKDAEQQETGPGPTFSPLPILSSPARRHPIPTAAPRFVISTPAAYSTPQPTESAFLKPPRFRPPDPAEQTQPQTDPLPERFSPHRRGQKYVTGGLAAEVRDWLVNIETTIPANTAKKNKDDPWLLRLLVDEISGSGRAGMTLVRGRQVNSDLGAMIDTLGIVKVILAGEGTSTGLQRGSRVEVGKIVGIKRPVWEAMVDGEKYGVGVDWKVLP